MLAKYRERRFVAMHASDAATLPGGSLQGALWVAAQQGNLQLALKCIVAGVDVQHRRAHRQSRARAWHGSSAAVRVQRLAGACAGTWDGVQCTCLRQLAGGPPQPSRGCAQVPHASRQGGGGQGAGASGGRPGPRGQQRPGGPGQRRHSPARCRGGAPSRPLTPGPGHGA